jgi:EAL domain-containing protein (putative c-di-GMP-specific phosphodiesterase class I)
VLGAVKKPAPAAELRRLLTPLLDEPGAGAATRAAAAPASGRTPRPDADALRRAIAGGELVVHYQPKVALDSGRVLGVEALVRWQLPGGALLGPDHFIDLAEEHGLIGPLTDDVLARALAQLRRWSDAGLSLHVAVNVSMLSLIDQDFPDRVLKALQVAGVSAAHLVLEITESRLMQQPVRTLDVVTRLRLKRVGVSIDDFGTGHSSLAQLHDLPFEELKLDRRFVTGAHAGLSQQAIIVPTLEMAHQLAVRTVAEGVETLEDWRWLQACGCDAAQGWFIGRPMVAERMLGWLAEWEARRTALVG